jgi:putative ABC transport system permease protein
LLFSTGVSLAASVLFGLAPAWQASRSQPIQTMRASSGQAGKLRLGRFFVSVQVAFAFGLVIIGLAFLFSLRKLTHVDTGFRAQGVAAFDIQTAKEHLSQETLVQLTEQLRDRVGGLPGVTGTASSSWPIFSGSSWSEQVIIPGKPPGEREEIFYPVSDGYFKTLGIPLIAGRDFERADYKELNESAVIVNQAFAAKYFPVWTRWAAHSVIHP